MKSTVKDSFTVAKGWRKRGGGRIKPMNTTQTKVRSTEEALSIVDTMKLALDALENTSPLGFNMESDKRFYAAITAIKEALAQPEQEPVAWMRKDETCTDCFVWERTDEHTIPLYITPPQRTWVGLTDEEVEMLVENKCADPSEQIRFVEAKLKEKNYVSW